MSESLPTWSRTKSVLIATDPAESDPILKNADDMRFSSPEVIVSFEKSIPLSRNSIDLPGVSDEISIAPATALKVLVEPM